KAKAAQFSMRLIPDLESLVQNDSSPREARLSAPGAHGHADFPLEEGHEIARVVESAGLRDGGDRGVGRRKTAIAMNCVRVKA
ncbi:MAG: hypothetical protein Q4G65_14985, partial [bacterium]|nr:hypothetical protein [bacterium]